LMTRVAIRAEDYDLQKSMEPSFVSSMYVNKGPGVWVKISGTMRGLRLEQRGDLLEAAFPAKVDEELLREVAITESGLWHEAFEKGLSMIGGGFREVLESLAGAYPGVRIPIAPRDLGHLLISVLLSKRANYDMVRSWCRKIWSRFPDPRAFAEASIWDLGEIGRSYQLFEAVESIRDLSSRHGGLEPLLRELSSRPPEVARLLLLEGRGVGPKTADSIILSAFKAPHFAPCDVHLRKFVERTRIIQGFTMPSKQLCRRYVCTEDASGRYGLPKCPNGGSCLRGILTSTLGELAGWFQTLTYLHGRRFCRTANPRCEACPLREVCRR